MAQLPTERETKQLKKASEAADERKRRSQAKQGKEFVNHGQGVIPESVWKRIQRSNQ